MIGVIDYGAGNLGSVMNALLRLGVNARFAAGADELHPEKSPFGKIIFPGDGHFASAMHALKQSGYDEAIKRWIAADKPFLGICIGLQLLFESSEEAPGARGLGILEGCVRLFPAKKVPHTGWNQTRFRVGTWELGIKNCGYSLKPEPATGNRQPATPNSEPPFFYYIHSYYADPKDRSVVAAVSEHEGLEFCAAVERGRLFATQFHPEKSGEAGIALLKRLLSADYT